MSGWYSDPKVTNCTFTGNSADEGGGIFSESRTKITDSILWADIPTEISFGRRGSVTVTHCDVQGGWEGQGNTDIDPCFVEAGFWDANGTLEDANDDFWVEGDYHLLPSSVCIDAGDPNYIAEPNETDLDGNPRIIGRRVDMGAYEYNPPIPAEVDIEPHTLNLESRGRWITAFIQLPEEYDVSGIDPNSVFLENEIKPDRFWLTEEGDIAVAKFGREEVQSILDIGEVELTITGRLNDGTVFEATGVVIVIDQGGKK